MQISELPRNLGFGAPNLTSSIPVARRGLGGVTPLLARARPRLGTPLPRGQTGQALDRMAFAREAAVKR